MDNNDFETRSRSGNIALFGIICLTVLFFILTRGGANAPLLNFLVLTPETLRDFQRLCRHLSIRVVRETPIGLRFPLLTATMPNLFAVGCVFILERGEHSRRRHDAGSRRNR